MDEETVNRISSELDQVRIVSTGAWHIIRNWRVEVGTAGALAMLGEAIASIERHSRELRRGLETLMPARQPKEAPTVRRFTHREHPRGVRGRCRGVKKDGKPCGSRVDGSTAFCRHHQSQAEQGSLVKVTDLVAQLGHLLPGSHRSGSSAN